MPADERKVAEEFGRRLLAARERARLTQEQLAERSSVHQTQISTLELAQATPRLPTILKLAAGLGLEPCELIGQMRWDVEDGGGFRVRNPASP